MHPSSTLLKLVFFGLWINDPNFLQQLHTDIQGIYARFERLSMPFACCDTSSHLSTLFLRENCRNYNPCQNPNNLAWGLELVIEVGEKFSGPFHGCRKTMWLQTVPSGPTRTPFVVHGLILDIFKWTQLCKQVDMTIMPSMHGLNEFRHSMQVNMTIVGVHACLFHEETIENA